ncbi:hypothetical protein [Alkalicoccus saliphilus]|uniref:Uncharacterized protein n=1 Tax=Alkalicoccus saliphilus TaxID=200989 RepID=A0A2T4U6V7_9BACI|nr:hypothetical protein [Alkalicoccus saliphilus]PTL39122.1 hypothetical protein C6Y45_08055 [Alkalicoccus saliphilus]
MITANVEIESIRKEGRYILGTLLLDKGSRVERYELDCLMKKGNAGFEHVFLNGVNLLNGGVETGTYYSKEELYNIYAVGHAAKDLIIDFHESENIFYKKSRMMGMRPN